MTTSIILTGDDVKTYQEIEGKAWHGYKANPENDVNPFVLNTHGIDPFPCNQGTLTFTCSGTQLKGALEHYNITETVCHESLHFLTKGNRWDYARTMANVSWKKIHDDWGLVEPDPDKIWITDKSQIADDKTYVVECHGGWGYVFIREDD